MNSKNLSLKDCVLKLKNTFKPFRKSRINKSDIVVEY